MRQQGQAGQHHYHGRAHSDLPFWRFVTAVTDNTTLGEEGSATCRGERLQRGAADLAIA